MQTTVKKTTDTKSKREKPSKDEATKPQDDKLKRTTYPSATPRSFVQQKTSTADIYGQKKKSTTQGVKAPKKSPSTTYISSNVSPMNDVLKSSPSSTSHFSTRSEKPRMVSSRKFDPTTSKYSATPRAKDFNVTVNSPIVKRKLNMDLDREKSFIRDAKDIKAKREKSVIKEVPKDRKLKDKDKSFIKDVNKDDRKVKDTASNKESSERQRTKTRTLDENEVKVLKNDGVDNNVEMLNLSRKLNAQPKAFYIDLDDDPNTKKTPQKPSSDEDISYEDDFESYESDFDSYHSSSPSEHNEQASDGTHGEDDDEGSEAVDTTKEVKDDERMLDSDYDSDFEEYLQFLLTMKLLEGNKKNRRYWVHPINRGTQKTGSFDLRDQRSANKLKPVTLDFILETAEGAEKPSSLTDEGFQEMSSSSAVSSMRTVHIDVLDRPIFVDFTKSKETRRKKRIGDRLRQRAKDLLSIITLHEMSYSLFEMKPISYDLYMSTFGRSNYKQIAVQTFDDGITEEVQTDEIELENKWTQHPVEFTNKDICLKSKVSARKYSQNMEDYLTKFTFLTTQNSVEINNAINLDENYKTNPLRIYFEQKDGAGPSEMLPYETYKTKLKKNDYNSNRLSKFLKKIESKVCNVLNSNSGNTELSELKITKLPFSKGYVSISTKNILNENLSFLNHSSITLMCFSNTKSNLIMTVHKKAQDNTLKKCTICLWDISVAIREPVKILTAIDNVVIGRFRGATDGYFAAALDDGSIHLWDLSEEPSWRDDVASEGKTTKLVEVHNKELTEVEKDREWNKLNSNVESNPHQITFPLQSCAFTSSAYNITSRDPTDRLVGLELTGHAHSVVSQEGGRKVLGQVVSLQRTGVLTIWSIVQQKSKTIPPDIGKAYWSKMKLEKNQTISLLDHIDIPLHETQSENKPNFNLNAAKRRITNRNLEKNIIKKVSRPKSAASYDFDSDRPSSAASAKIKRVLSLEKDVTKYWESGVMCYDLKVMFFSNCDNYLVAKNCGEVVCCKRILGTVRVHTFCVAAEASSVTCIETSPHRLPYFLAATDTGTISVCSLLNNRVLLTLDCRNIQMQDVDKCQSDHKGRYISSVNTRYTQSDTRSKVSITSLAWSRINPCCLFASLQDGTIVEWELSYSDIYAKCANDAAAIACTAADSTLALLTPEGEVQVHKLTNEHKTKEFLKLFEKYIARL